MNDFIIIIISAIPPMFSTQIGCMPRASKEFRRPSLDRRHKVHVYNLSQILQIQKAALDAQTSTFCVLKTKVTSHTKFKVSQIHKPKPHKRSNHVSRELPL